jgi:hypothetical protein
MSTTKKNNVFVELYDLPFTEREDDRFGRVVTTKSLNETDLVNIAVSRRTDLNATTLKAGIQILKDIAIEEITNGASVAFGPGVFRLKANGVFVGDNAQWDKSKHSLSVNITPSLELRTAVKDVDVNVRGMAHSGIVINSVTDMVSGEENTILTPGGGVNVKGCNLKIEGDAENTGLSLTNKETGDITRIPLTSVLINDPSKISFIVPPGLPQGAYTLSVSTQYVKSAKLLKEPRCYTFEYELTVIRLPY